MKAKLIVIFVLILTTPLLSQVDENIVWEAETINHADMDISPNDSLIAATYLGGPEGSNKIGIYDLKTGEILRTLENPGEHVQTISFSNDGNYLISAGNDDYFLVWNVEDWSIFKKVIISSSGFNLKYIFDIEFSNDGYLVALGGRGQEGVLIYDLSKEEFTHRIKHFYSSESILTADLDFSSNDKYLAISCVNNPMRIVSLENDSVVFFPKADRKPVCFSPDGKYFAVELEESIQLYSTNPFNLIDNIQYDEPKQIHNITFSRDSKYIIVSAPIEIFDAESRMSVKEYSKSGGHIELTTDNKFLVIAGSRLLLYKSGLQPTNVSEQNETMFEFYPNPSANSLTINFELEQDQNTRLSITDILGNEPLALKEGFLRSGTYNFNFDISGLPSGIYFIRLLTDKDLIMRKLIVGR